MSNEIFLKAKEAATKAYSPFSGYKVGAALLSESGTIYQGCNVENSSYGATVCAERVAIWKAVSHGETKFSEIVVYTKAKDPWPPCSLCQQVMAEFFTPEAKVHLANESGIVKTYTYKEINPFPFVLPTK